MINHRCKGIWETESTVRRNCKGADIEIPRGSALTEIKRYDRIFISPWKLCSSDH